MPIKSASNPSAAMSFLGMSQAVRAGDFVFLSGQVAFDSDASLVGIDDPALQAQQIFRNITALLEAQGGGLESVVRLTCYATSMSAYEGYAAVKAALFPMAPPAATTVIVASLLNPQMLLEVEATAVLPGHAAKPLH